MTVIRDQPRYKGLILTGDYLSTFFCQKGFQVNLPNGDNPPILNDRSHLDGRLSCAIDHGVRQRKWLMGQQQMTRKQEKRRTKREGEFA